ncbi:unnamed protein product, partial [marine sediment metagenome]
IEAIFMKSTRESLLLIFNHFFDYIFILFFA